jgi:Domain of unknown function (DUF4111)
VTIVVEPDVRPWRYPPPLDLQYGDWWRPQFERGDDRPWDDPNPDVAILLAIVRDDGWPLIGPAATDLLDPVPAADVRRAMLDGIPGIMGELDDDTSNVLLTLARIWTTLETGEIRSKDAAADWVLARTPADLRAPLARARAVYVGEEPDRWKDLGPLVRRHAAFVVERISASGS